MSNNCYLLRCTETGDQVLVDAAAEPDALLGLIGDGASATVVTTHQHWDHHRALAAVVEATGAEVVAGAPDADAITEQTGVAVDRRLGDGDKVAVGACRLRRDLDRRPHPRLDRPAVRRPDRGGHPHLFTGDSLFPGGVGATFGDDAAFAQLIDEVETKVFGTLPDDTWVYPGHGGDTVLGRERPHLATWRERGW